MRREDKGQVKVSIDTKVLWRALSKDFVSTVRTVMPQLVTELEILEGDGGLGTVYLFRFSPDVPKMSYQMEKVSDFDESAHEIGLQVIEGGRLDTGFTYYKTSFKLDGDLKESTLVEVRVDFEVESVEQLLDPEETVKSAIDFIRAVEKSLSHKR